MGKTKEEEKLLPTSKRTNCLRWMSLLAGGLAHAMMASNLIFYVYINDIKARFQYDQKEVEAFASMLNAGIGLGFIPNLIGSKLKSAWVLVIGMVLSISGLLLLWSSTKLVSFYEGKSWLMAIYFIICGLGGSVGYIMALRFNAAHFADDKRGRIIAAMFVFIDSGMITFTLVYYRAFTEETRFENLMVVLMIFNGIVYIFCMFCLRPPEKSSETNINETEMVSQIGGNDNISSDADQNLFPRQSCKELLFNLDYHLLAWFCSSTFGVSLLISNNMTVLTKEEDLSAFDSITTLVYPPIVIVTALSTSFLSDKVKPRIPRLSFLIIGAACLSTSSLINAFLSTSPFIIIIGLVLAAMGTGMVYTIGPTTMSEMFHIDDFMRNWGLVMLMRAIVIIILHITFGAFYDIEVKSFKGNFCKGLQCTRNGYILTFSVSLLAICLGIWLSYRRHKS